ncbi:hypothetical protein [Chelativorans sp. YIM 93263]|uniref:hypothetical protein n=1 Tax=Chelativorans sp. YIM 93263 TaxID=2906648 RepID=UPI002379EA08|nr:hypothetical protein [Chelativorans sp. YIM 93263]
MRDSDPAFVAALQRAREEGILPPKFLWARVKDRVTGAVVERGFWSGDDTVMLEVISGQTGMPEMRTYVGGADLQVGSIPRVSNLTIQTIDVSLSAILPEVQEMVRGYNARLAPVEIHTGLLHPDTRMAVSPPEIEFLGQIDEAPIETAATGGESRVRFSVRSDGILMLTRKNPRKRSYEGQKRRQNDQLGRYSNVVRTWQIPWGMEIQNDKPPTSSSELAARFRDMFRIGK